MHSGGGWPVLVWECLCVLCCTVGTPKLTFSTCSLLYLASGYQQTSLFEGAVAAVQLASCTEVF